VIILVQIVNEFHQKIEKAVNAIRAKIMEEDDNVPNWGCVSVFTCTGSCGGIEVPENSELGAYIEEFSWKQPSLD